MTKEINLTQGQVAIVDDWNYDYLSQWKWHARWSENTQSYYAMRTERNLIQKTICMHRQISKTPNELHCDHINHNTLDNRESNLRNVTPSRNSINRHSANSNNLIGEKNISYNKSGFLVRIKVDGKFVYCKNFHTLELAKTARDKALEEYHGKF